MTEQQIRQLINDYYECEFGIRELIRRTEDVVLANVYEYLSTHNLKREDDDYLLHVSDNDVLISSSYIRKIYNELKERSER